MTDDFTAAYRAAYDISRKIHDRVCLGLEAWALPYHDAPPVKRPAPGDVEWSVWSSLAGTHFYGATAGEAVAEYRAWAAERKVPAAPEQVAS